MSGSVIGSVCIAATCCCDASSQATPNVVGAPAILQSAHAQEELTILGMEIKERLGVMFDEFRGSTPVTTCFKAIDMAFRLTSAIILGLMKGASA